MPFLRMGVFALALAAAPAVAVSPDEVAREAVQGTNAFRRSQGLDPVKANGALEKAAKRFAGYMAKTGRYGHTADGRRPPERAAAQGYEFCIVSENIAYQYRSTGYDSAGALAGELVEGWKRSPEHRRNMLDPAVSETGLGVAQSQGGRYYAVQMFGRPKSAALRFSLQNRSGEAVDYRVGERRYALEPRTTRVHTICRPATLSVGGRFSAQAVDGAQYAVAAGGDVEVHGLPAPGAAP